MWVEAHSGGNLGACSPGLSLQRLPSSVLGLLDMPLSHLSLVHGGCCLSSPFWLVMDFPLLTIPGCHCLALVPTRAHHTVYSSLVWCSSRSVMSNSLWPHGLQHARLPRPSPSPGACSNACLLSHCCPLLLLPSIFPSIRVSSNESALRIRWPQYWSYSSFLKLSLVKPFGSSFCFARTLSETAPLSVDRVSKWLQFGFLVWRGFTGAYILEMLSFHFWIISKHPLVAWQYANLAKTNQQFPEFSSLCISG